MYNIFIALISLALLLLSAHIFCNALEHLGEKLGISEGVTGSIFAAIGTAAPETIITFLSLIKAKTSVISHEANSEIGMGAILGAPFMLSTLSLFIMALAISFKRGAGAKLHPARHNLINDMKFFLIGYLLALSAAIFNHSTIYPLIRLIVIIGLLSNYLVYLYIVTTPSKNSNLHVATQATDELLITKLGFKLNQVNILTQLLLAVGILIFTANLFVNSIKEIALFFNLPPFLLALVVIPIATELPEKFNSIIWLYKGKDTLAFGNILGSLTFQGTFLPLFGLIFNNWSLEDKAHLTTLIITIIAVLWLYFNTLIKNLRIWIFLVSGILYIVSIMTSIHLAK